MAKKKVVKKAASSSRTTSTKRMDNNTFLIIVGGGFIIAVIISMFLLGSKNDNMASATPTPEYTASQSAEMENANIVVTSPKKDEGVDRPVTITGRARVFENTISYRVKDEDGFVLVSGSTTYESKDAGEFGDFSITTNYLEPKGTMGSVEVYNASAKDGSDENLVSVPVTFE